MDFATGVACAVVLDEYALGMNDLVFVLGMFSLTYLLVIGVPMLVSLWVSSMLKKRFAEHSMAEIPMSGMQVAEKMLREEGITDVQVISTPGRLTDHYNPMDKTVNLSEAVCHQRNVAAAAVAAHEVGHAVQHARAYRWLTFRSKMVPAQMMASKVMNLVFMLSLFGAFAMGNPILLWIIVIGLGVTALFSVVTLPVEFDASKRAMVWMQNSGIASSIDQGRARNALHWAAMTYVVAALGAIANLAYWVFQLLGNRD